MVQSPTQACTMIMIEQNCDIKVMYLTKFLFLQREGALTCLLAKDNTNQIQKSESAREVLKQGRLAGFEAYPST